jgi:hypothetical protein
VSQTTRQPRTTEVTTKEPIMGEFFVRLLIGLFVWVFMLPISFVAATPFLLLYSFFGKRGYFENLGNNYRSVYEFWIDLGNSIWNTV